MGAFLALAGALAFAVPAAAEAPFAFDAAPGRLPKNVRPVDYRIAIVPNPAALTFTGTETVVLDVRSATATIQFNSLNETLSRVRFDGVAVAGTRTSDARQLTSVTLRAPAVRGRHVLSFAYRGRLETTPQGLFVQRYAKRGGGQGLMLTTQFESTDARRMFPCWDEPAFRATFTLTATAPADLASVSNMPIVRRVVAGRMAVTTFARTPPMPSYLVAYSVGELARIGARSGGTTFGVWAVKGQEGYGRVALADAQRILADYNAYFGVRYPLPKLDSVAIPGGFPGAMENWGAISYTAETLLVTPSSTAADRQDVFSYQAHEMAHQWNGDLVTMGWWDDLWLNESFASWRSAKETDARHPEWNWWEGQDSDKESAMRADARLTSHAIRVRITDELQAETAFDNDITYSKGQAFLRMLETYLTPDVFRAGIRAYVKARAFSNATGADLWLALGTAAHADVAGLAAAWIDKPGFPLVTVAARCDSNGARFIALGQRRFLLEGSDPRKTTWTIPLAVRSGPNGPIARVLLGAERRDVPAGRCGESLTVNAGNTGFFRVAYGAALLLANTVAFGTLPEADRIALLDDQWALASSGQAELGAYFALARSMGDDLDKRAWEQIAGALETIERAERGTAGHDAFVAFARSILKPVADRLGWDARPNETADVARLRLIVLGDLGTWGDAGVVAEARKRFSAFVNDRRAIAPDFQRTILTIVAQSADAATFDQLHAIAKSAVDRTESRRYYRALMSVRDDELARRALGIALSGEISSDAATSRFGDIAALADAHPALAWAALKQHVDALIAPFGPSAGPEVLASGVPQAFWDAAPAAELEGFVKARIPRDLYPDLARGMESARFLPKQKALLDRASDAYLANT